MQHHAGQRKVDPVPAQIGEMLDRVRLPDKCPDKKNACCGEKKRTGILQHFCRRLRSNLIVRSNRQMDQRREQNVNVPRSHEQSQLLRNRLLVGKIHAHEFPGRHKNDEHHEAEDEMKP